MTTSTPSLATSTGAALRGSAATFRGHAAPSPPVPAPPAPAARTDAAGEPRTVGANGIAERFCRQDDAWIGARSLARRLDLTGKRAAPRIRSLTVTGLPDATTSTTAMTIESLHAYGDRLIGRSVDGTQLAQIEVGADGGSARVVGVPFLGRPGQVLATMPSAFIGTRGTMAVVEGVSSQERTITIVRPTPGGGFTSCTPPLPFPGVCAAMLDDSIGIAHVNAADSQDLLFRLDGNTIVYGDAVPRAVRFRLVDGVYLAGWNRAQQHLVRVRGARAASTPLNVAADVFAVGRTPDGALVSLGRDPLGWGLAVSRTVRAPPPSASPSLEPPGPRIGTTPQFNNDMIAVDRLGHVAVTGDATGAVYRLVGGGLRLLGRLPDRGPGFFVADGVLLQVASREITASVVEADGPRSLGRISPADGRTLSTHRGVPYRGGLAVPDADGRTIHLVDLDVPDA
jgi:hypothetical protein